MRTSFTKDEASALSDAAYWSVQFLEYGIQPRAANLAEYRAIPGWSEMNDRRIAALKSARRKLGGGTE